MTKVDKISILCKTMAKKYGETVYLCYRDGYRFFRSSKAPQWATNGAYLLYVFEKDGFKWS